MASLDLNLKTNTTSNGKIVVELDVDQLERLAASVGFLNPEFLESLERSEKDFEAGNYKEIKSLSELK